MYQNILAILFILKLVKRSKFYAPTLNTFKTVKLSINFANTVNVVIIIFLCIVNDFA